MKLLTTILLAIVLFVSCDKEKEETKSQTETKIEEISQKIDSVEVAMDSVEAEIDSAEEVTAPPQKSPSLKENNRKSISELWNTYKKAKSDVAKALDRNDIESVVNNLSLAGNCAEELGRMDIAAWQFNNIGHYSIIEFKRRTRYDQRLQKLATMPSGNEKAEFQQATQDLFIKEYPLLEKAREYLVRAQIIDDFLEPGRRTEVIQSNIDFVEWIKNFTGLEENL